ncbi:ciliogenesis-associated TTC17-interacting protein [Opisthocomus hoazin]|uniref:ciliogenesis-associated TTC17-interacting protein n=1 Tax=Opisthocomus hoazin TaxID=30419 RepID=UPI003F532462
MDPPPPECRQETPALTEAAAEFLSRIGPEELERCLFAETLDVVAAGDLPRAQARGQWWASARWAPYERAGEGVRSCVLVQAGSRIRQDGVPSSSTLKAYVTPQLETLEQEEQERLELRPHPIERRTHMVSHQHGMTVTKSLREGEAEPQCQSFSYSRAELRGLLPEGASLLLLRALACQWAVPPGLAFPILCTSSYVSRWPGGPWDGRSGVPWARSGRRWARRRCLSSSEPCTPARASPPSGTAASSPAGVWSSGCRSAARCWCCCRMSPSSARQVGRSPSPPSPNCPWTGRRTSSSAPGSWTGRRSCKRPTPPYIRQHPELRALLTDFLRALLLRQPRDPVSFAAQFFAPFASAGAASPLPSPPPRHPPADGE